jgi:hypothetical protein
MLFLKLWFALQSYFIFIETKGHFNFNTPIFGELFRICFRVTDRRCHYDDLLWYASSDEENLGNWTFRVAPFYDILTAIGASTDDGFLFIFEQLGSPAQQLLTYESPEFIKNIIVRFIYFSLLLIFVNLV